ncbi:MAG: hypothetical protein WC825_12995 [Gallionellaceae bacterium]|jgi:hypothetical protein
MFDRYLFLAIVNVILMVINAVGFPLIAINGDGVKFFEFKAAGRWTANYAWMVQFGWNLAPVLRNGEVRNLYVGVRPRVSLRSIVR